MIYKLAAFSNNAKGGNLAGVVLNADEYPKELMLNLAKDLNYSETAFVMKSDKADFKIRYFTPLAEIDLCGHATIATFNLLRELGVISIGNYTLETNCGLLEIIVNDKEIFMEQNLPRYFDILKEEDINACFQGDFASVRKDLPVQIVSTGLRDIILPIRNSDLLFNLKPNFLQIEELSNKFDVIGIHAFSLTSNGQEEIQSRNFAPRYGIKEEAATGTANAALACYLHKHLKGLKQDYFVIKQGLNLNKPSLIKVSLEIRGNKIIKVFVGGTAIIIN